MKLSVEQLKEAHFQLDQFIRDPILYKKALKRSKSTTCSLVQARRIIKKAMDLLGDDEFFNIIAMCESGPLAPSEKRDFCVLNSVDLKKMMQPPKKDGKYIDLDEVIKAESITKEWASLFTAVIDNIPVLKESLK